MAELGPRIAAGRSADIYSFGRGVVLRRYRSGGSSTLNEAALMQYLRQNSFPVPEVYEANATDIVMEHVIGPTMLDALTKNPASITLQASRLARLHHDLHLVPAPDWSLPPFGEGSSMIHMDLHPANVLLTKEGPVVIDWGNARLGPPGADPALAWILLTCANPPGGLVTRALVGLARNLFVKAFLRHFDLDELRDNLDLASRRVVNDRNLTYTEQERIQRFLERNRQSTSTDPPTLQ